MTLLWADGFDGKTATLPGLYDFLGTPVPAYATYGTGRPGGSTFCLVGRSSYDGTLYYKRTISDQSAIAVGFAMKNGVGYAGDVAPTNLFLYNGTTVVATVRLSGVGGDGMVKVYRGNNATLLGTSAGGVVPSDSVTWNYWEFYITASTGASGVVTVVKDGMTVLSLTNQNTGTSAFNGVMLAFATGNGGFNGSYDDYYITDGNLLGDVVVKNIVPSNVGTSTGMTSSAGANWSTQDEVPPTTADWVSSSTANTKDTYAFSDVTGAGVVGVVVNAYAAKDAAGRAVGRIVAVNGANTTTGSDVSLSTTAGMSSLVLPTPPGGGTWDIGKINGAEFGWEVRP